MQLKNCSGAVGYICNALSSTGTDIKETAANQQLVVMTRSWLASPLSLSLSHEAKLKIQTEVFKK